MKKLSAQVKSVFNEDKTPPKGWWDKMQKEIKDGNPDYSQEQVDKTIGDIWYHKLDDKKRHELTQQYETLESMAEALTSDLADVDTFDITKLELALERAERLPVAQKAVIYKSMLKVLIHNVGESAVGKKLLKNFAIDALKIARDKIDLDDLKSADEQ